ncbi:MAG: acetolactate synthase small subunit [bacterium]|nr:acetolactate synthase small subunit [bacterium]
MNELKRFVVSALVENRAGVLAKISGLFSARGYNIDSLAVGETEDPTISRMTIVVKGNEKILEQILKQLNRLIDVIKVFDLSDKPIVERDLILIKIKFNKANRSELIEIVDIFRGKIVDVGKEEIIVEITGDEDKIEAFIELAKSYGIVELARTGIVALQRTIKR